MKALSIRPDFALMIATGFKTVECRTWKTDYRGDIVICSTAKKIKDTIPGHAICVAELKDCCTFTRDHLKAAVMSENDFWEDAFYAWVLGNVRLIEPIPVKGKLSLWNFNEPIKFIKPAENEAEEELQFDQYYRNLLI